MESALSSANETITQLEGQIASLQDELREGQQKALGQQKELEDSGGQLNRLRELEAALQGVQDENTILKQTNESLVEKTLSSVALSSKTNLRERNESGDLKVKLKQNLIDSERLFLAN